jgi:hypothetical protein
MAIGRNHVVLVSVYALSLAAVAYLLYEGRSYYLTPLIERPRHPDYWALKPGGTRGYWLGVAGTALMVVMHVYSVRRRSRPLRRLGPLRAWLDFHIWCGIVGPLLIVLHSSFKVQGLVALSFWSMVAVSLSGVLGRYLYLQIPRRKSGDELSLAEAEEVDREMTARLRDEFGLSDTDLKRLDDLATADIDERSSLVGLVLRFPFQGVTLRWKLARFARRVDLPAGAPLRSFLAVVRQKALIERRIGTWQKLQQLFHYWHVFHKPFAIVMYLFLVVHVSVVIMTGYGWGPAR